MKKLFLTLLITLIANISFAEQGQIKQQGIFTGQSKVIGDDKGNFTVTYDGVIGLIAIEGTTFGDKSSSHCLGSIVSENGKPSNWKYVSGTGKYANITGGGTSTYTPINSAKEGTVQSFNQFSGTYNLN